MYESSIVRKAQHAATTDVRKSFIRRSHQLHVRRRDVIRMVGVKSLLVGQSFGQVGDAATSMVTAQMLLFVNSDASVRTSLFTSIGMMLPVLLLAGPLAGVLVDRLNRRGILVYGHFLRGILVISLMWALHVDQNASAMICFALTLALSRLLYSARVASVVHFVRRHELPAVDSMSFIVGMVSGLVGGGLAAVLIEVNWQVAFIVAACLQVAAGLTLRTIRLDRFTVGQGSHVATRTGLLRQLVESKIKFAIGSTATLRLLLGVMVASVALYVGDRLSLEALGFATLLALISVGNFLGSVTAEWFIERFRRRSIAVMASVSSALLVAVALVVSTPGVQLVTVAFCAFAFQNLRICTDSSVQANTPDEVLGRVFAAYDVVYNVAYALGVFAGVLLFGVVPMALVLGLICFSHLALAVVLVRGTETLTIQAVSTPAMQSTRR
jgi:MFS family permease